MIEPAPRKPASDDRGIEDSSLFQLTVVRFREFWREPEAVFWVFIFPILLAVGLGIAFRNTPATVIKIGASEPALAARLANEKGLSVETLEPSAAETALRHGRIVLLASQGPEGVVFRYDDTNPEARTARLLADRALRKAAGVLDTVNTTDEIVREPGSRYIDFVVPGLLGMNLMGSGIWGLGFSIVDARRKKLLRRLVASPMPRWQFLLSFLLSRLLLLLVEVAVFVGFAILVFGVPLRGSLPDLAFLCLLASLAFSAVGLLIASRARTIEAASGLMNLVMLPMWVLSGVFFSADRYPDAVQPLIRALPLTAVIDALRANMLQGATLSALPWQLAVITAWLVLSFVVALRLFRWQ
ncbi:MAG: ABC transporter permease [Bryobacteraceae bacterium]